MGNISQDQHQFRLETIAGLTLAPVLVNFCWLWLCFCFTRRTASFYTTFLSILCQLVVPVGGTAGDQEAGRLEETLFPCSQHGICHWPWQWQENLSSWVPTQAMWAVAIMAAVLAASVVECPWALATEVTATVVANIGPLDFLQHWGHTLPTSWKMAAAPAPALFLF